MCPFFHFIHITEFTSKTLEQFISYKFKNAGDTLYLVLLMKLISNFENILEKKQSRRFHKGFISNQLDKDFYLHCSRKIVVDKKQKSPNVETFIKFRKIEESEENNRNILKNL